MKSQNQLILDALQSAHGDWVAMPELAKLSGSLNIHTRINDLRDAGHVIENHKEREVDSPRIKSFYRLVTLSPSI